MFDKIRDVFPFYINRIHYFNSNTPSKVFYASVGSEAPCIARTTTDLIKMVSRVILLLIRMAKQSSECIRII